MSEFDYLRDELRQVERDLAAAERAPLDWRVADWAAWNDRRRRLRITRDALLDQIAWEEANPEEDER